MQAQVAHVGIEVEELLHAALAGDDVAQLVPVLAIVGCLQRVLLAIRVLPDELEVADRGLGAEVELDPGVVGGGAFPARAAAAIDGFGRGVAARCGR